MRIISGAYKGKNIVPPKTFKARPTTDFAKESLFNIISNNFNYTEIAILDLFAGTGSISYEFASRGCKSITTVELDYKNFSFINQTIEKLNFTHINVLKVDAFKILKSITEKFDIIFADPPYTLDDIDSLPDIVFNKELLVKNGWFILEHSKDYNFSAHQYFIEIRKYGSVNFSIFSKK
ncbi:RsmD family RNA methyltransferase [Bacteroidota bacterium]